MSMLNPYEQYKQTQVATASQGSLILMLYDAALRQLRISTESMKNKKVNEANNALIKSQEIIMELNVSLNMDAGDIALKLRSLYLYIHGRLIEANVHKDVKIVEEVIVLLSGLKEAWDTIIRKGKATPPVGGIDSGI